jgi:NTP pyrophosphatase (non-canonical NTP hydrolase)
VNIYVASKFENQTKVRAAYATLRAKGHTITHDWTQESDAGLGGDARRAYHRQCAEADLKGVLDADGLLLLDHPNTHGADIEVGVALGKGIPVVVVGCVRHTIFYTLPNVKLVDTIDVAIDWLEFMHQKRHQEMEDRERQRTDQMVPPAFKEASQQTAQPTPVRCDRLHAADYQRLCARTKDMTLTHRDRLTQFALGLTGEAGETAEVVKKHLYHDARNVHPRVLEECGDVLWYAGQLLLEFGLSMEDAMRFNLEKTRRRRPVGAKVRHLKTDRVGTVTQGLDGSPPQRYAVRIVDRAEEEGAAEDFVFID